MVVHENSLTLFRLHFVPAVWSFNSLSLYPITLGTRTYISAIHTVYFDNESSILSPLSTVLAPYRTGTKLRFGTTSGVVFSVEEFFITFFFFYIENNNNRNDLNESTYKIGQ